jgi:hypothetical protein
VNSPTERAPWPGRNWGWASIRAARRRGVGHELGSPDNAYDAFEFISTKPDFPTANFWVFPTTDTLNVGVGGGQGPGPGRKQLLLDFIASRADLRGLTPVRKNRRHDSQLRGLAAARRGACWSSATRAVSSIR